MDEEKKVENVEDDFSILGTINTEKGSLSVGITSVTIHDQGREITKKITIHELTWEQIFKPFNKQKVEIIIKQVPTRN